MRVARFRIRTIMIGVAISGLVAAGLRLCPRETAVVILGAMLPLGAFIERRIGGKGILGGSIGGLTWITAPLFAAIVRNRSPAPPSSYPMNDSPFFLGFAAIGGLVGCCVGMLIWVIAGRPPADRLRDPASTKQQ